MSAFQHGLILVADDGKCAGDKSFPFGGKTEDK